MKQNTKQVGIFPFLPFMIGLNSTKKLIKESKQIFSGNTCTWYLYKSILKVTSDNFLALKRLVAQSCVHFNQKKFSEFKGAYSKISIGLQP